MKCLLFLLAIGLTSSEKLDRIYLPPPGAQFAGGRAGDIQTPLELPNIPQNGATPIGQSFNNLVRDFGPTGHPTQAPVTTTSYAYTQTTTFPTVESYETTVVPINPVTGLPVRNYAQPGFQYYGTNVPSYTQNQVQLTPGLHVDGQPAYPTQGSIADGQSINIDSPSFPTGNQPQNQYTSQNIISSGINAQLPGSQHPENTQGPQYPSTGIDGQNLSQYGLNINDIPGSQVTQGNQALDQYPGGKIVPEHQAYIPATGSPQQTVTNNLVRGKYSGDGPQAELSGLVPQGTYSGQPINIQDSGDPHFKQGYQSHLGGNIAPSQIPNRNQIIAGPGAILGQNIYQPEQDYNHISSTPAPGITLSPTAHSDVGAFIITERPHAAADRNAVIINYEDIHTPNGYSYSYDTSNGIHADETGIVDNGTKAQGSYSYTGDDGKIYSVIYTADENGFQPHGDHLPTPPPIPEAIKKVIEQAARDKAAGIFDDGSYDEAKYGYKKYRGPMKHRHPQIHNQNEYDDTKPDKSKDDQIKPISGLTDEEYDDKIRDKFSNDFSLNSDEKSPTLHPSSKHSSQRPSSNIPHNNYISGTNERTFENDNNNAQFEEKSNEDLNGVHPTVSDNKYQNEHGKFTERDHISSGHKPISIGAIDTKTHNGGYQTIINKSIDDDHNEEDDVLEFDNDGMDDSSKKSKKPSQASASGQVPTTSNRKLALKQRPNGYRQPGEPNDRYANEKRPTSGDNYNQGDLSDFISKGTIVPSVRSGYGQVNHNQITPNREKNQQIDDEHRYHHIGPQTQLDNTQFPTRSQGQDAHRSTIKPMSHETLVKHTARPFQTPEVYHRPTGNQQYENHQSTTLEPFMTSRVSFNTTPKDSSYTDYDDGEDYTSDDLDDENINSTVSLDGKTDIATSLPYHPTTSTPQYTPSGQKTRVTQKGTVTPGYKVANTDTVTAGYIQGSTHSQPVQSSDIGSNPPGQGTRVTQKESVTPGHNVVPTQSSRFGFDFTRKPINQQHLRRPSRPGSTTTAGRPVSSQHPSSDISESKHQTTKPVSRHPDYLSSEAQPSYGSRLPSGHREHLQQKYPTYKPISVSTTPVYQPGSGITIPSRTSETYQSLPTGTNDAGYHYGPFRSEYPTTTRPGSIIPGAYPTSIPGYYQTTPHQKIEATVKPPQRGRPGHQAHSGPGTAGQTGPYQYESTTPGYAPFIESSDSDEGSNYDSSINTDLPGSYVPQTLPSGHAYGPSSTIGTTSRPFIPSTSSGQILPGYFTTPHASHPYQEGLYDQNNLVDGFGRPISTAQHPGYISASQEASQYPGSQIIDEDGSSGNVGLTTGLNAIPSVSQVGNIRPVYNGEHSPNYPGYYDKPQVIGEDFSGPKQKQRFDPNTGYHY